MNSGHCAYSATIQPQMQTAESVSKTAHPIIMPNSLEAYIAPQLREN
jgi:hypothetical protein